VVDGSLYDDATVKTTLVRFNDALSIVSFAGVAHIGATKTLEWLTRWLQAFNCWDKGYFESVSYIRDQLNQAKRIHKAIGEHGLEVIFSALTHFKGEKRAAPRVVMITNKSELVINKNEFKDVDPQGRDFVDYNIGPDFRYMIGMYGYVFGVPQEVNAVRRKLEKEIRTLAAKEPHSILMRMVDIIRLYRMDKDFGRYIGENCLAMVIKPDYSYVSTSFAKAEEKAFFPNIVQHCVLKLQ